MTMLTHPLSRFKPASYQSRRSEKSGAIAGGAHIAMLRRCCRFAVAVLLIGGGVAGIIALKAHDRPFAHQLLKQAERGLLLVPLERALLTIAIQAAEHTFDHKFPGASLAENTTSAQVRLRS